MALAQIQRRYSRFISSALTYSKNPNPIWQFSSKPSPILHPALRLNFENRAFEGQRRFHNPKRVAFALFLLGVVSAIGISSGKWVTVPYTERSHFVLFYKFQQKFLARDLIMVEGELVNPLDPDSVTARKIFEDIIDEALPLETEKVDKDECELFLVDSDVGLMNSTRFANVCLTNAFLRDLEMDEDMIANLFAHDIAYDLAKHPEEHYSKWISTVSVIGTSVYLFWQSTYARSKLMSCPVVEKLMRRRFVPSVSFVGSVGLLSYLIVMKCLREMVMEVDHVGVMLASSAGYDPRVGIQFYPSPESEGKSELLECFSSMPSGRKRGLRLARPEFLDEAVSRYRKKNPQDDETDSS